MLPNSKEGPFDSEVRLHFTNLLVTNEDSTLERIMSGNDRNCRARKPVRHEAMSTNTFKHHQLPGEVRGGGLDGER